MAIEHNRTYCDKRMENEEASIEGMEFVEDFGDHLVMVFIELLEEESSDEHGTRSETTLGLKIKKK